MFVEMNATQSGDAIDVEDYDFKNHDVVQILVGTELCLTLNRKQAKNLREGLTRLFPQKVLVKDSFDVSTYSNEGGKL